jgi:hypothetical protein
MSIFSSIMSKIFHTADPTVESSTTAPEGSEAVASPASSASSSPEAQSQPVDVEAVLTDMASRKGGGGNWQTSIVDLLKLLDLDSSLGARTELGAELNVHAGADGSAEQNIALHKAVMQKLAENGGKVPASMRA